MEAMYTIGSRLPVYIQTSSDYKVNKYEKLAFRASRYIQAYCHELFVIDPYDPSEVVLKVHPFDSYEEICEILPLYVNFLVKTYRIEDPRLTLLYEPSAFEIQKSLHMLNTSIQNATNVFLRNMQLEIVIEVLLTESKEFR